MLPQKNHITQQTIIELYKILGSANLLKDPVNYFSGFSQNVDDLFYEPHRGEVCTEQELQNTDQFDERVLKKLISVFDDVPRLTTSRGRGLPDPNDDLRNNKRTHPSRPKASAPAPTPAPAPAPAPLSSSSRENLSSGAAAIASGFGSGLAGLFTKPIEGLMDGSALGFVKGLGQGAVGAVTKPIAGLIDGVTKVTQGLSISHDEITGVQKRLQRHIDMDRSVGHFNERKALGARLLYILGFKEEFYVAHIELSIGEEDHYPETLVLSNKRLLLIEGFEG